MTGVIACCCPERNPFDGGIAAPAWRHAPREIQSVHAFGQETEVMQLQTEVARRLAGSTGLQTNMRFNFEHMRLAAIQCLLIDADGGREVLMTGRKGAE